MQNLDNFKPYFLGRRRFFRNTVIGLSSAIGLNSISPFISYASKNNTLNVSDLSLFASESGIFGKDKHCAIGLLIVDGDYKIHEEFIKSLRLDTNYKSILTYHSNDGFKMDFARSVINYFKNTKELKFSIKLISEFPSNVPPSQASLSKIKFYNELLSDSTVSIGNSMNVQVKSQSPFGPTPFFVSKFKDATDGVTLLPISTYSNDLLQISSFLLGTIMLDIRGGGNIKSPKFRLLNDLKSALDVSSFTVNTTLENNKIIIR